MDSNENESKTTDPIAQAVHAWFVDHVYNSPVSQDTVIFNHLIQAKNQLINKLKEAVANESV